MRASTRPILPFNDDCIPGIVCGQEVHEAWNLDSRGLVDGLGALPGTVGAERAFPWCEVTSMNFQHLSINQSIHPYEILIAIVLLVLLRNDAVA